MKKFISTILAITLVFGLALTLASCGNKDDGDNGSPSGSSGPGNLAGTRWATRSGSPEYRYNFSGSNIFMRYTRANSSATWRSEISGNYKLSGNDITFTGSNGQTWKGKFSGNSLSANSRSFRKE